MESLSKLSAYNTQVFNELKHKFEHFQLGFFNGADVMFLGQNPGQPFNKKTQAMTDHVLSQEEFHLFEAEYEAMMKETVIGKYLDPVIMGEWYKASFTNTVKIATEGNAPPSEELYEFFFPILMKQIDLLQPKVIACLGKYAGSAFGLDTFYSARRYRSSVVCMYPHPSYIMRKGRDAMLNEQVRMKLSIEELLEWSVAAKYEHETEK